MKTHEKPIDSKVETVRTYCAQCFSNCPVVAHLVDGEFVGISADKEHRFHRPLCPKGFAGPELVSSKQRLRYPLKRTTPKGAGDPGWERISWNEALDTVARQMAQIKEEHGAEAFVFSQTNVSSPVWEITSFVRRLANIYGSPNHMTTTHICNWHRDNGSALTYGKPGDDFTAGWPDFTHSHCMLIWGHNPANTFNAYNQQINSALKRKAKLIVVDPRRTKIAAKADSWLQVRPGSDGALALGMIHLMLEQELYDADFVSNWTNAPLLLRADTGDLLRVSAFNHSDNGDNTFAVISPRTGRVEHYIPGKKLDFSPELEGSVKVSLLDGETVWCETVFSALKKSVAQYTPAYVEQKTTIPAEDLINTVRLIVENSPCCWYSFNGVEQNINATQTNRAICLFYALTGDYDRQGGNHINSFLPPLKYPFGFEFVTPEMFMKNMAIAEHPLGPAGTIMSVPPHLICKAIEKGDPYPVKGLMVFGANTVSANPDSKRTSAALKQLDFHVHIDHFLNPTAELADIVLPSASFWETGRIGAPLAFQKNKWVIQWREPVAAPRGESRDELWIIFEIAKRLGFSDTFWHGSLEAAFEEMLIDVEISLDTLKEKEGGVFIQGPVAYQKYRENGFSSSTGRVELFSQPLKDIGQAPLPEWNDPITAFSDAGISSEEFPFLLITAKLREFCQSQHRALPFLRKKHPQPFLEINHDKAESLGIGVGDTVSLSTVHGEILLQARLSRSIAADVVCTQHGWWQACPELGHSGADVYSARGANVNLLFDTDFTDKVSGSVHMRGFPCKVRKSEG
ncbi:molybdopterin-containing oxidoreductase family protein [Desulfogranum mediterraneum]|uniref:molybdopterin-containing oxidoreductase family protein n=1 Tax=Desulfogranum mediterraneum TaxID=160661 RepID=UPI00048C6780|nr:molybdopterin-dependent oxidoreductase [Desulfogranum mediterraneum]